MNLKVAVDRDKCTGCGKCIEVCPVDVLRADAQGKAYAAYDSDCHTCLQCEGDCPEQAITISMVAAGRRLTSIYDAVGIDIGPLGGVWREPRKPES